ncbi:hypothetical protein D3C85_1883650 [compost metagenome]
MASEAAIDQIPHCPSQYEAIAQRFELGPGLTQEQREPNRNNQCEENEEVALPTARVS